MNSPQSKDFVNNNDAHLLVVGIATTGRPAILQKTIDFLALQTRLPDRIIICPASQADLPECVADRPLDIQVVRGNRGLAHQRNAILTAADDAKLVIFFDDDFFAAPDYIASCEALFAAHEDIAVATGWVFADGIGGPGLPPEEAEQLLAKAPAGRDEIRPTYGAYGCNMALRMDMIRRHSLRFDENLPLYGWQEDIDFSRQLSRYGRVVKSSAMRGVHLGHKSGRTSGVRTGYSQIANPWYLAWKGTLSIPFTGRLAVRNFAANIVRSFRPEPWVDRRGRLRGNFIALADILRGRCHPNRVLEL